MAKRKRRRQEPRFVTDARAALERAVRRGHGIPEAMAHLHVSMLQAAGQAEHPKGGSERLPGCPDPATERTEKP